MSSHNNDNSTIFNYNTTNTGNDLLDLLSGLFNINENLNNEQNIEETIPCEICNVQISLSQYTAHSMICLQRRELSNRIKLNAINRTREDEIMQDTPIFNYNQNNNTNTSLQFSSLIQQSDNDEYFNINETNQEFNDNVNNDDENNDDENNDDVNNDDENNDDENNDESNNESLPQLISDSDSDLDSDSNLDSNIEIDIQQEENNGLIDNNNEIDNLVFINQIRNRIYNNDNIYFNEYQRINLTDDLSRTITNIANSFLTLPIITPLNLDNIITELDKNTIENNHECPICFENLNELQHNIPVKTICNHIFCKKCICKWFNTSDNCPICKENMREI